MSRIIIKIRIKMKLRIIIGIMIYKTRGSATWGHPFKVAPLDCWLGRPHPPAGWDGPHPLSWKNRFFGKSSESLFTLALTWSAKF